VPTLVVDGALPRRPRAGAGAGVSHQLLLRAAGRGARAAGEPGAVRPGPGAPVAVHPRRRRVGAPRSRGVRRRRGVRVRRARAAGAVARQPRRPHRVPRGRVGGHRSHPGGGQGGGVQRGGQPADVPGGGGVPVAQARARGGGGLCICLDAVEPIARERRLVWRLNP
jgi:hypothetical protein